MPQSTQKRLYGAAYCVSPEQRLSVSKKANFGAGKICLFPIPPKKLKCFKRAGEI
jgi:hypothetical protein